MRITALNGRKSISIPLDVVANENIVEWASFSTNHLVLHMIIQSDVEILCESWHTVMLPQSRPPRSDTQCINYGDILENSHKGTNA